MKYAPMTRSMVMMGEVIAVLKCEWFFNREI
jgi:hypothetical protein